MAQRRTPLKNGQVRRPSYNTNSAGISSSRRGIPNRTKRPKVKKGIIYAAAGVVLIAAVAGTGNDSVKTSDGMPNDQVVATENNNEMIASDNYDQNTVQVIPQITTQIIAPTPTIATTSTPTAAPTAEPWSLKPGDRGDEVQKLQLRLISLGYLSGSADGIYGEGTEYAVRAFQRTAGLNQTGVCDENTATVMKSESAPVAPTPTPEPTVYISPTGNKYHRQSCRTIDLNTARSGPLSRAKEMGYTPCGVCNPPS